MTSLLLVEDDPRFRVALQRLLEPHYTVHAMALGQTALARATAVKPALAIVDMGLPDIDGVALVGALRAARPDMPVLVLTIDDTRERVTAAIEAGAAGYLLKDGVAHELFPAIEACLAGESPLSPRAASHLVRLAREGVAPPLTSATFLTRSERLVLDQLARGLTYEQIGLALDISINTVRTCVRALYDKLDAGSRTEAVVIAAQRGLIRLDT